MILFFRVSRFLFRIFRRFLELTFQSACDFKILLSEEEFRISAADAEALNSFSLKRACFLCLQLLFQKTVDSFWIVLSEDEFKISASEADSMNSSSLRWSVVFFFIVFRFLFRTFQLFLVLTFQSACEYPGSYSEPFNGFWSLQVLIQNLSTVFGANFSVGGLDRPQHRGKSALVVNFHCWKADISSFVNCGGV